MSLTEKIGTGVIVGGVAGVVVVVGASVGAAFGALGGQVLDWIPYLNTAIPEGIAYLGNAVSDTDTTQDTLRYLEGNLDKVGAVMGFVGGYLKSSTTVKNR
ncbi:MAG TPA: hypothetical protein VJC21_04240 [Candidatus Nanoarchaeia archaeon]|nr:hypothetical protein [Candidatus Nanoarchaeia archaeon]